MRGNGFRPIGESGMAVLGAGDAREEATCFADEVVIDFPSVAPAVARMRRAFVDPDGEPLAAALHLSPHEARDGARVPLEVPVRCTCERCGGRGESWTEPCGACGGTGATWLRHRVQVAVPAGVADGTRFHFTVTPRHNAPTRIELHVLIA